MLVLNPTHSSPRAEPAQLSSHPESYVTAAVEIPRRRVARKSTLPSAALLRTGAPLRAVRARLHAGPRLTARTASAEPVPKPLSGALLRLLRTSPRQLQLPARALLLSKSLQLPPGSVPAAHALAELGAGEPQAVCPASVAPYPLTLSAHVARSRCPPLPSQLLEHEMFADLSPLHRAVAERRYDVLNALLTAVNELPAADRARLVNLRTRGVPEVPAALASAGGAQCWAAAAQGATALHLAAVLGDVAAVSLLLNGGCDPGAVNEVGLSPACVACVRCDAVVLALLVPRVAHTLTQPFNGLPLLLWGAATKRERIVRIMWAAGRDMSALDAAGRDALDWAVQPCAFRASAPVLLQDPPRPAPAAPAGLPPVLREVDWGLLALLLALGVARDVPADQPLPQLLRSCWRVHATKLHVAVLARDMRLLSVLLRGGASTDARAGSDLSTPLHWAARTGWAEGCLFLINCGADVNARTTHGWTPAMLASACFHTGGEVLRVLLARGACLDLADDGQVTAAHVAAACGVAPVVRAHRAAHAQACRALTAAPRSWSCSCTTAARSCTSRWPSACSCPSCPATSTGSRRPPAPPPASRRAAARPRRPAAAPRRTPTRQAGAWHHPLCPPPSAARPPALCPPRPPPRLP